MNTPMLDLADATADLLAEQRHEATIVYWYHTSFHRLHRTPPIPCRLISVGTHKAYVQFLDPADHGKDAPVAPRYVYRKSLSRTPQEATHAD